MADLVQMEDSFKQNSVNVILHYHYTAPQPDGVLMITGLEATRNKATHGRIQQKEKHGLT